MVSVKNMVEVVELKTQPARSISCRVRKELALPATPHTGTVLAAVVGVGGAAVFSVMAVVIGRVVVAAQNSYRVGYFGLE